MSFYPHTVSSTLSGMPSGVDSVRVTLRAMSRLVRQYKKDVGILTLARQLTDALPEKNYSLELVTLQHFVRDRIRYVRDVHGVETLQTPVRTLEIRSGDCDDKATLLAALLASVGFPTQFIALGFNGGPYSHVITAARLGTKWIPCETILPDKEPGWLPENITRYMVERT